MKQIKKKPDPMTVIMFVIVSIIATIFLSLHSGMVETDNWVSGVMGGIQSCVMDPMNFKFTTGFFKYLIIYIIGFSLAGIAAYAEFERNAEIDKKADGKAQWFESFKKFSKQYTDSKHPFNNIILTQNVHLSMNSSVTRRNNNVLVVGGSGSGKTRFMIKPNILQANCSFVITDPKGEILQAEGEMLRKHGYKIKVFNLTDMTHSNSYNPFQYIRDDLGVLMMINCLIKNTNNGQKGGGDPFWEKSETALLQALVFYLKDNPDIPDDCKNFTNVMKLLRAAEINEEKDTQSPLDLLFAKVEAKDPNSLAVKQYKTFKMGAGKTLKSILISCAVRLTVFNLQEIENLTMSDDLKLEEIGNEKTALFVVIPAADDTYNFLVSMMYSQLFETLYYRAENECPYEYYIKDGVDVLAIAKKNKLGDKYTMMDAERIKNGLMKARIKTVKKDKKEYYTIETKGVKKEFYTRKEAEEFKDRLSRSEIVKGAIRLPYPVRFLLDEFANIGQIPDFTKKLATMRQYEISCTIILQNLAQIKTMYKDDWESIVGNCDSFLFLGGQEYSTLEYISKLLGKQTVVKRGRGRSRSGKGGSSSVNDSRTGTDLMSPSEISTMPKSDCILIINGLNPFYDKKFDLTTHPHYKESGDSSSENKYDYKQYILNHGQKTQSLKAQDSKKAEKEMERIAGKPQPMMESILGAQGSGQGKTKEEIKEAVSRITIKKGIVVANEHVNKETGDVEFDYNLE